MAWLWQPVLLSPAAPAEPDIRAAFTARTVFNPYRRRPDLLWNRSVEGPEAQPEPSTFAPFFSRHQFLGYRHRPDLGWNRAIEGLEQRNDVGSSVFIVPTWDGYRLARVQRYIYWQQAGDPFVAPPAETGQPPHLLLRHPFKPFGRNRYIFHQDYASAPPIVEGWGPPFFKRPRWGKLGRNRYVWHVAHDESFVGPTFNPAWAKNANALIRRSLVA